MPATTHGCRCGKCSTCMLRGVRRKALEMRQQIKNLGTKVAKLHRQQPQNKAALAEVVAQLEQWEACRAQYPPDCLDCKGTGVEEDDGLCQTCDGTTFGGLTTEEKDWIQNTVATKH